jgi:outer membrane protein assembly factor BamB
MMKKRCSFLVIVCVLCFSNFVVIADEWPQWRGPNRDGVWKEEGIVEKLDEPALKVVWRKEISGGYCGPTVADNRVYVMDRVVEPKQVERVLCFDAITGEQIWSVEYECRYRKVGYPIGPRASVSIDEGCAYSLGTMGHLYCFDAANGEVVWKKDLNTEYKIRMPIWGITASPLIENDLVIVQIGGKDNACVVAFDKVSGKERWRSLEDKASYSASIVIEQAGKRVLVCWTGERIVGLNPVNGELYWEHPFKPAEMIINVPTPVFRDNYIFISAFFDGSLLLKVSQEELSVEKVWRRKGESENKTDSLHCMISTPVILGEHVYGVDSYGELRCLDLKTGDRIWESLEAVPKARWANIHMVENGEHIWMFNERGELIISKLSEEGFEEISRTKIIEPTEGQLDERGGVCWTHPAFAYKNIYVRNDEELICVNLAVSK